MRDVAHGDSYESIVGRFLSYPLTLKVLECVVRIRAAKGGGHGMNLRYFCRRSGRGGQP